MIKCRDGSIYCGATNNIEKRLRAHNEGKGSKYTKSRLPVVLLLTSCSMSRSEALKLECKVKKQEAKNKVGYLRQFCGCAL